MKRVLTIDRRGGTVRRRCSEDGRRSAGYDRKRAGFAAGLKAENCLSFRVSTEPDSSHRRWQNTFNEASRRKCWKNGTGGKFAERAYLIQHRPLIRLVSIKQIKWKTS